MASEKPTAGLQSGVASIDYEHQEIVALLSELAEGFIEGPDSADVTGFLSELYARLTVHFTHEEEVMRSQGYPRLVDHKADHEHLLDQIRAFLDEEIDPSTVSIEVFGQGLLRWFAKHLETHDVPLHRAIPDLGLPLGEI